MPATFENLEPRRMMSATLKSGVLRVAGTAADDVISVQFERGKYVVRTNGARDGAFTPSTVKSVHVDAGAGDDYVTVAGNVNRRAHLVGGAGDDALLGGPAGDTLDGGAGDDALRGRGGDDRFVTGAGHNAVDGGAGSDTIDYAALTTGVTIDLSMQQAWVTDGDAPDDAFRSVEIAQGGQGHDWLYGSVNTVALYGNGGNDDLNAGTRAATSLFGGAGNDNLEGAAGAPNLLDGGPGVDLANYRWRDEDLRISMDNLPGDGAAGENDNVVDCENLGAGDGDNLLVGNDLPNVITGDWGNDTIRGLGGNDTLNGDVGADSLDGGDGNDSLNGDYSNDTLVGGPGRDTMHGEDGDDYLYARDTDLDVVYGGPGNDRALINGPSVGGGVFGIPKLGDLVRETEYVSEILI